MFKHFTQIVLFLISVLLVSCASIDFLARESDEPNGYSYMKLGEGHYLVAYESYIKNADFPLLEKYARRALNILSKQKSWNDMEIIDIKNIEYEKEQVFPEQVLSRPTGFADPNNSTVSTVGEIVIPAHVKLVKVKKVTLEVKERLSL